MLNDKETEELYIKQGNEYYNRALDLYRKCKYSEALEQAEESLCLYKKADSNRDIRDAKWLIRQIVEDKNLIERKEQALEDANKKYEEGCYFYRTGGIEWYEKAREYLIEACDLYEFAGETWGVKKCEYMLNDIFEELERKTISDAEYYKSIGDYENAKYYYEKAEDDYDHDCSSEIEYCEHADDEEEEEYEDSY